jgi:ABC-2 type transport system ATP-binding protein
MVEILGHDVRQMTLAEHAGLRRQMAMVLSPSEYDGRLKIRELLDLFDTYYGRGADVAEIMCAFDLEDKQRIQFGRLTPGWKQRVSLAIGMLAQPQLLLLDDMTTGLAPAMRGAIWRNIQDYVRGREVAALITTQDMQEVERYADKLLLLTDGVTEAFGAPHEVVRALGYTSLKQLYLQRIAAATEAALGRAAEAATKAKAGAEG